MELQWTHGKSVEISLNIFAVYAAEAALAGYQVTLPLRDTLVSLYMFYTKALLTYYLNICSADRHRPPLLFCAS